MGMKPVQMWVSEDFQKGLRRWKKQIEKKYQTKKPSSVVLTKVLAEEIDFDRMGFPRIRYRGKKK